MRHVDVITGMGGGTKCAEAINAELSPALKPVDREAVYKWKKHDSIPAKYWPAIVRAAAKLNLPEVTTEALEQGTAPADGSRAA